MYSEITRISKTEIRKGSKMNQIHLEFIKAKRIELGFSHEYMAFELGLSDKSQYWKREKGEYSFKLEELPKLAKVFECDIANFFV
jgi:transcriptional regulator with XRE-family HTH domain